MSQENVKPEQIQASVAAALSRLRGDVAPPSDAPDTPPQSTPASAPAPTGMAPGMPGMGRRPDPMRPPANDLRAEPGLRSVASTQSGMGTPVTNEPPAAKEPELPRAMFSRPGPAASSTTNTPAQPAAQPQPAPTVERPPNPLSRIMSRETPGAETAKPATVEKAAAASAQADLLAGLPPPPLGEALTQEDDGGARRRRNRRILMLSTAIVVVAGALWLFTRGGGDPADVPVISAEMTPEKVKPADEGGLQVPNQNVQVLDNSGQSTEGETVLPPPEQPVTPPEATAEAPQPAEPPAVIDSDNATVIEDAPPVTAPEPAEEPAPPTTAEAPAVPAPAAPEPTAEAPQPTEPEPAAPAVSATTPEPTPEPAVPAPQATATPEAAPAPEPAPKPAPTTTQESAVTPPPAPAAVGSSRVQLAAVKSEDMAKAEWAKIQKAHPDLLGSLALTVESVDKNGTTFYRIQAGPLADRAAAKQLCASLKGQGQDCIVAK
jgi:hypothetical protein